MLRFCLSAPPSHSDATPYASLVNFIVYRVYLKYIQVKVASTPYYNLMSFKASLMIVLKLLIGKGNTVFVKYIAYRKE